MKADPEVRHNEAGQRFESGVGDDVASCHYQRSGSVLNLHHTEVPHQQRGRGTAAALVKAALDYARAQGLKVVPSCSYVRAYMRRHPATQDLLKSQ